MTAPNITMGAGIIGVVCPDCKETVDFRDSTRRCSCGLITAMGNGVRLTPKSVASRTIPIELVRGRTT